MYTKITKGCASRGGHVSCIYKSVCLFTSRVALSTWPEAWESHERMGSPGQAFLISCGESPKPGKQTFAHFFTISTWGKRQLTWGKRQLPSPCWDCINFFLPAYCEKQPGIRYWYSSIQSKLKCRGVGTKVAEYVVQGELNQKLHTIPAPSLPTSTYPSSLVSRT